MWILQRAYFVISLGNLSVFDSCWCWMNMESTEGVLKIVLSVLYNDGLQKHLRIIESWRLKRSFSPAFDWIRPYQLNHSMSIRQCHVQSFPEHFQAWWLHNLPGQSIPILNQPLSGKILPKVQPELKAISSGPVAGCLGEDTNPTSYTFLSDGCGEW